MTIDLSHTDPRWYLMTICRELTTHGYADAAERIRTENPRDLAAAFVLLPDDVAIQLWEVSDEPATCAD